MADNGMTMNW